MVMDPRAAEGTMESRARRIAVSKEYLRGARELARDGTWVAAAALYRAAIEGFVEAAEVDASGTAKGEGKGDDDAAKIAAWLRAVEAGGPEGKSPRRQMQVADRVAHRLSRQLTVRTPRQARAIRLGRIGAAAVAGVLFLWLGASALWGPRNVALRKPVTAVGLHDGQASAAVDGVIEWGSFGFWGTQLTIDLLNSYDISSIRVLGRGDLDATEPLTVTLSDDGVHFDRPFQCADPFTQAAPCRLDLKHARARYVRLKGRDQILLSEVEVLGKP
jgi:hypothetical protein